MFGKQEEKTDIFIKYMMGSENVVSTPCKI